LARLTGYSYEHCRKVLGGLPVVSKAFNAKVCGTLALDVSATWQQAVREKAEVKLGGLPDLPVSVGTLWVQLRPSDQQIILRLMQALARMTPSDF